MIFEILRAEAHPGESWARAADRVAAGEDHEGPVLAVDLSGDPLLFQVDHEHRFAVRPMTEGDLGDVSRWVSAPHVARWWDEHRSPEQVAAHYGPALRGEDPVRLWVWEVNGRSVGFSQDYRIGDHPDYAVLCRRPDAVGVDYLIGEEPFTGRGLGASLLWVYLRDIVWPAYPEISEIFAAPDHRNGRSLRLLDKMGFERGLWFDEPRSDGGVSTVIGCSLDVKQVIGGSVTDG